MNINYFSLIIAGLMPMIFGFIYYHPKLMGTAWMNVNGFTAEKIGKGPKPVLYLLCTVLAFLFAFFLWAWTTNAGATEGAQWADANGHSYVTFGHGVVHGCIFTLMILLPIFITSSIFEMRGFKWAFINIGYWGLCSIMMCGLLSAWR